MLNINKWITFMLENQLFEIMEDIKRNDEAEKPTGNAPKPLVGKPATGSAGPAGSGTKPAPSSTPATPKPTAQTQASISSTVPDRPAPKKSAEKITPAPEKAPAASAPIPEKKSKKLMQALKKLKIQKGEIASLEKNRDRLMKDLISAIESKKKSKKIRNLARDFNRIEKRVKARTSSYIQAKKKLAKEMK
jgi:hypothetical protein